jgi:hypothetical protein
VLTVGGIDPGLASGGLAVVRGDSINIEVLAAASFVEPKGSVAKSKSLAEDYSEFTQGGIDKEFTAAMLRADQWMIKFKAALDQVEELDIDAFAVESFVDQRSRAREEANRLVKNRWQTPIVIGMIAIELAKRDYKIENNKLFYQNAGIIIRHWSKEIGALKARQVSGKDLLFPGDACITNDHQRKALAHGLGLLVRLNAVQTTTINK